MALILSGQALASASANLIMVAGLYHLATTSTPLMVALFMLALHGVPALVAPYFGQASDRLDKRKLLFAGRASAAISLGAIAFVLVLLDPGEVATGLLILASAIVGACDGLVSQVVRGAIPLVADSSRLVHANTMQLNTQRLASVCGQLTAGAVLLATDVSVVIGLAAFAATLAACADWHLPAMPASLKGEWLSWRGSFQNGWAAIRRAPGLGVLVVHAILFNAAFGLYSSLLPRHIADMPGTDSSDYSMATAALAVGSILLMVPLSPLRSLYQIPAWASALIATAGWAIVAAVPIWPAPILGSAVIGIGLCLSIVQIATKMQTEIHDDFGLANGAYRMIGGIVGPLSVLATAKLAAELSISAIWIAGILFQACASAWLYLQQRRGS